MGQIETYKWEAEKKDGTIITKGGDLSDCIRFSLIPLSDLELPRHDLIGITMLKRFRTTFKTIRFNGLNLIPGGLRWEDGTNIVGTHEDLREIIKPGFYIRQCGPEDICPWCLVTRVTPDHIFIAAPYKGKSAPKCNSRFALPPVPDRVIECIVCKGFKLGVNVMTGAVLIGPEDYEINL